MQIRKKIQILLLDMSVLTIFFWELLRGTILTPTPFIQKHLKQREKQNQYIILLDKEYRINHPPFFQIIFFLCVVFPIYLYYTIQQALAQPKNFP